MRKKIAHFMKPKLFATVIACKNVNDKHHLVILQMTDDSEIYLAFTGSALGLHSPNLYL
jgi:hypothetical protein